MSAECKQPAKRKGPARPVEGEDDGEGDSLSGRAVSQRVDSVLAADSPSQPAGGSTRKLFRAAYVGFRWC